MKGQSIEKYQLKELNLIVKPDKKTRNCIISLPRDKMPDRSRENSIFAKCRVIIDIEGQIETKYNRISILVL